jgi:prepilin-type N-terminal cleavage/methylation domain-containing protein
MQKNIHTFNHQKKYSNAGIKKIITTKGFSLIELMVVLTILGILTAIAVPTYHNYIKRARYAEIIQALAPYKMGVSLCYQNNDDLKNCSSGDGDIPPDISDANNEKLPLIKSITVSKGVIKATPKTTQGFTSKDTYQLTPTITEQTLVWSSSGGAVDAGYAK